MTRGWGRTGLVACGLAVAVACSSGGGRGARDTLPPAPPTTSAPAIDVTKVPATIDVAYVQAVMDKLDPIIGDAVRMLAAKKVPTPEFVQLLDAVYEVQQSKREQESYGGYAADSPSPLRPDPANPTTRVMKVIDSSPTCIVSEVSQDYGPIFMEPRPDRDTDVVIELHLKRKERDPANRNDTAWTIAGEGPVRLTTIPTNPCP